MQKYHMKKEGDIYQSTVPVNNIIFSLLQLNNFFQLGGYVGGVEGRQLENYCRRALPTGHKIWAPQCLDKRLKRKTNDWIEIKDKRHHLLMVFLSIRHQYNL